MTETIESLWATILARRDAMPAGSYTSQLFAEGMPRIAQKVGEEAVESVVAALAQSDERLVSEMADLVYHCLVMLAARRLSPADVSEELERRFK